MLGIVFDVMVLSLLLEHKAILIIEVMPLTFKAVVRRLRAIGLH